MLKDGRKEVISGLIMSLKVPPGMYSTKNIKEMTHYVLVDAMTTILTTNFDHQP